MSYSPLDLIGKGTLGATPRERLGKQRPMVFMDIKQIAQQGKRAPGQQAADAAEPSLKRAHPLPRCVNCDIEIAWPPTIANSQTYCCPGCAQGGPCTCDYSQHSDPDALA